MEKALLVLGLGVFIIILMAVMGLVAAIPVLYLWNWLMPDIFGLVEITYWQAWGLFWLASILLKSSSSSSSSS